MFRFIAVIAFFLFIFLLVISVARMFIRALFGAQFTPRNTSSNQQKAKQSSKQTAPPPTKKIISPEEGEYVDFEEIKE